MTAKTSPRRDTGGQQTGAGSGTSGASISRLRCPWLRAAARTGDDHVVETVVRLHPPSRCPLRRERAA